MLVSGSRQLALKRWMKSSLSTPFRISFMGGMRNPSWKMSAVWGDMLPGNRPPTSM